MAEAKRNSIVVACAVVGCIVTLLTCGTLIGNVQGDVRGLIKDMGTIETNYDAMATKQASMESKQAYLEGVVSTKLDSIQTSVSKMEKQVDDLMRVP